MTPPQSQEAASAGQVAEVTFKELGVPVASHKTESPDTQVMFLGFLLDTDAFQLRLPEEKLEWMRAGGWVVHKTAVHVAIWSHYWAPSVTWLWQSNLAACFCNSHLGSYQWPQGRFTTFASIWLQGLI